MVVRLGIVRTVPPRFEFGAVVKLDVESFVVVSVGSPCPLQSRLPDRGKHTRRATFCRIAQRLYAGAVPEGGDQLGNRLLVKVDVGA